MTTIYIALGSNQGDSPYLIREALKRLAKGGSAFKTSRLHQTEPVACSGGPFINAVCTFETTLTLPALIAFMEDIEHSLGKKPKLKNEARLIDLDLLFYGSQKYSYLGYTIPHPHWQKRRFVLEPLLELTKTIQLEDKTIDLKELCSQLP